MRTTSAHSCMHACPRARPIATPHLHEPANWHVLVQLERSLAAPYAYAHVRYSERVHVWDMCQADVHVHTRCISIFALDQLKKCMPMPCVMKKRFNIDVLIQAIHSFHHTSIEAAEMFAAPNFGCFLALIREALEPPPMHACTTAHAASNDVWIGSVCF